MNDELLSFAPESETGPTKGISPWKVLIADDDEEVHVITKLALADYNFLGQPIEFLSAHNQRETINFLRSEPDIALVLLDVVMDQHNTGLEIVKFIRDTLSNPTIRIILRTGDPGSAPEREIITNYDINDYKEKTELSSTKLYTAVHTSIKNYCDIRTIKAGRAGLTKIIHDVSNLYSVDRHRSFIQTAIEQFANLVQANPDVILLKSHGPVDAAAFRVEGLGGGVKAIAGVGRFEQGTKEHANHLLSEEQLETILTSAAHKTIIVENGNLACSFASENLGTYILFFEGVGFLRNFDFSLVDIFLSHICQSMEAVALRNEITEAQNEIIHKLGEVVEFRSAETSAHVSRVSLICRLLGTSIGLPPDRVSEIAVAAVLHDIGKAVVPETILNKPAKLTEDEMREVMQHTVMGHKLLASSSRSVIVCASRIALEHHEKWDGTGYPNGKKATEISLDARIVALADVYDALRSKRSYKTAWDRLKTRNYIIEQAGSHFDPVIVEHFVEIESQVSLMYDDETSNYTYKLWSRQGLIDADEA